MIWDLVETDGQVEIPIRESRSKSASSTVDVKSFKGSNASSFYEWTRDRDEVSLEGRLHKDSHLNSDSLQTQSDDMLSLVGQTIFAYDPTKESYVALVVSNSSVSVDEDISTREVSLDVVVVEDRTSFFSITIDSTNEPVTEGQNLNVDYTVENTSNQEKTKDIELSVSGSVEDTDSDVNLSPGDTQSSTLTWSTAGGDAGTRTVVVHTDDFKEVTETDVTINEF